MESVQSFFKAVLNKTGLRQASLEHDGKSIPDTATYPLWDGYRTVKDDLRLVKKYKKDEKKSLKQELKGLNLSQNEIRKRMQGYNKQKAKEMRQKIKELDTTGAVDEAIGVLLGEKKKVTKMSAQFSPQQLSKIAIPTLIFFAYLIDSGEAVEPLTIAGVYFISTIIGILGVGKVLTDADKPSDHEKRFNNFVADGSKVFLDSNKGYKTEGLGFDSAYPNQSDKDWIITQINPDGAPIGISNIHPENPLRLYPELMEVAARRMCFAAGDHNNPMQPQISGDGDSFRCIDIPPTISITDMLNKMYENEDAQFYLITSTAAVLLIGTVLVLLWKYIPSCSKKDEGDGPIIEEVDEMKVGGGRSRKGGVKISFIEALSILKELVEDELNRVIIEQNLTDEEDIQNEFRRIVLVKSAEALAPSIKLFLEEKGIGKNVKKNVRKSLKKNGGKKSVKKKNVRKKKLKKKSVRKKSVRNKSVRNKSVRNKSVRKKSVRNKSVRNKSIRKKSTRNRR